MTEDKTIFEVIRNRRSVRSYTKKDIAQDILVKLVDAARWAPTPSNVQSWRFIVVRADENLRHLKNVSPGFPPEARASIVVCSNLEEVKKFGESKIPILVAEEAAAAVQNILLAAHSLGLGSCPVASFSKVGVQEVLDLPDYMQPILLVALGYPGRYPETPERKELSNIIFWEKYVKYSQ